MRTTTQIAAAIAACAAMTLTAAHAEPLNWNYLEGVYYHEVEIDQPGTEQDGDGVGLTGSMAVAPHVLLQAGTENLDIDQAGGGQRALDRAWVGPGLYADFRVADIRVGPWARVAYERLGVGGAVNEGWHGALGLRLGFTDRVELALSGEYGDYEPARVGGGPRADLDRDAYRADLIYAVDSRWSLLAGYEHGSIDFGIGQGKRDTDKILVGTRWYMDATPGGAFAAGGDSAYSGEANYNYLQTAYQFGDEIEVGSSERDIFDGVVLAGAARVSERVVILGEATALNVAATGEAGFDSQSLGPAIRFGDKVGAGWLDLYVGASYERAALAGDVYTGGGVSAGARWLLGNLELAPRITAVDMNGRDNNFGGGGASADLDGQRYRLEALYSVSDSVALLANYERTELDVESSGAGSTAIDGDSYGLGLRFYYAGKS